MAFYLFLLLNAVLFVRPAELIPDIQEVRIYEFVTMLCLAATALTLVNQLSARALIARPITLCVVGLLVAVMLSHLSHLFLWGARMAGYDFFKVLVYYLLLVATVNTAARLRCFLLCLTGLIAAVTVLALLQYHEVIDLPALSALAEPDLDPETGQLVVLHRLRGTGIFNDPNDLSLILVLGVLLCLFWMGSRPMAGLRFAWFAVLAVFVYALMVTQSRGGLLALVAALLMLFQSRYGWSRAAALAIIVLPALLLLFGGRQTRIDLSAGNDTGQHRIQMWGEGLTFFRQAPLFGIGYGQFEEKSSFRLVAHNSYIHTYAELGLLGGSLFVGVFVAAFLTLRRLGPTQIRIGDQELSRLRPFLMAMLAGYMVGIFSLSRCYVIPTYLVPGLVTAYMQVTTARLPAAPLKFDGRLFGRLAFASAVCLAFHYCFVRTFAHYG